MNRSMIAPLAAAAALLFAAAGQAAYAQATGGPESSEDYVATPAVAAAHAYAAAAKAGPYARYLIHLGMDRDEALRQARAVDHGARPAAPRYASNAGSRSL